MKITANDFTTNRHLLRKEILRYCETFASYLSHLQNYFNEPLQENELRWAMFISQRIELFLKDAPTTDKYVSTIGRYQRVLTRLNKILSDESIRSNTRIQSISN